MSAESIEIYEVPDAFKSRARAFATAGWDLLGIFSHLSCLSILLPNLSERPLNQMTSIKIKLVFNF